MRSARYPLRVDHLWGTIAPPERTRRRKYEGVRDALISLWEASILAANDTIAAHYEACSAR